MIDDSKIDGSIIKRDFVKIYHQHGAEVNVENQNIKFYFRENLNFIQRSSGYLKIDPEAKKTDIASFTKADQFRLVNFGLAYILQEARSSTSSGAKTDNTKNFGPVSKIMRM